MSCLRLRKYFRRFKTDQQWCPSTVHPWGSLNSSLEEIQITLTGPHTHLYSCYLTACQLPEMMWLSFDWIAYSSRSYHVTQGSHWIAGFQQGSGVLGTGWGRNPRWETWRFCETWPSGQPQTGISLGLWSKMTYNRTFLKGPAKN